MCAKIPDVHMELLVSALAMVINHQSESCIPSGVWAGIFKHRTDVPGVSRRNICLGLGYLLSLSASKKRSHSYTRVKESSSH